jgi:hypothetical protein
MSLVEACSAVVAMAFIIALISAPARKLMRLAVIEVRGGADATLRNSDAVSQQLRPIRGTNDLQGISL